MSNLKVIEQGRRAREIWAKRLGFQIRTLPLNPDGSRPKPKAEVAETVEAEAETVEATEAKPEVAETVKAKAETVKATSAKLAKPEVKATPANVVIAQQG